jgi:hypothetical protein
VTPDHDTRDPNVDAAYRATPRDEPSQELDARILAAAHRAVDARPAPVRRSFAQRWRLPVALVATVVLSVTVTLMMYESERSLQLPGPGSAGKVREEAVPAQKASSRGDAVGNAAKREISEPREQFAPPQADESQPARAPAPAPPASTAPGAKKDGEEDLVRQREEVRELERKARELEQDLRKAQAASGAAPAAAPVQSAPAAAPSRDPAVSRERAFADRPAERSGRDALGAAAPARLQTPEEWLAEIRRLKAAGRIDEANRLLAEFRERYADFPIPEDLR